MHRNLPQNKEALLKSYTTRLKEDVKSMLENFEGNFRVCNFNGVFVPVENSLTISMSIDYNILLPIVQQ